MSVYGKLSPPKKKKKEKRKKKKTAQESNKAIAHICC
jgi:hypothetical protein